MSTSLHILLTGGTGFLGKSILSCVQRGMLPHVRLTVLSRNPETFVIQNPQWEHSEAISFLKGDIRSFSENNLFFDYIIHAATPVLERVSSSELEDIVVGGTEHVMDIAKKCGARRVLYVSSGAVYGRQAMNSAISESMKLAPDTEYGIAKANAERICLSSMGSSVIARCFTFIGPYLPPGGNFAVADFIMDALKGAPVVIHGDGTPLRSYMFADDLVFWLLKILKDGQDGQAYNVGSDMPLTILELAQQIKCLLNSSSEIQIMNEKHNTGRAGNVYIPDIRRAKEELGLGLKTSLGDSILRTARFYEKQYAIS